MASSKNPQALARTAVRLRASVNAKSTTALKTLREDARAGSEALKNDALCSRTGLSAETETPSLNNGMLRAELRFCPQLSRAASIRGGLLGRPFHSARVLQLQAPAFATEQFPVLEEERVACSTTINSSTTGPSENSASAGDEGLEIAKLAISRVLVDNFARRGITKLFPIQRAVLEPGLRGQDLIARAKTGTGKTLAFGIPILDRIIKENEKMTRRYGKAPLAVVMAPTRELAKQVENEFKESAPNLELVCVYGGVSIDGQIRQLQRGVDIAVGTPGRFIDLLERGSLNLHEVKYIVLDEADRMLAVGFVEPIQKIFQYLPPQKQSMLFSATMPTWVKDLARQYLKNPLIIDLVGNKEEKIAEGIKLLSISTSMGAKRSMLGDLIKVYGNGCKCIVFTQTKRDADDVAMSLGQTLVCEPLHGDITQAQRERTLKSFRDGKISVLIATDVAARGLDIPNVDLVIHYEVANDSETFVHRSGRTGRAGKEGTAILMHTPYQRRTLDLLERELGCRFKSIEPPSAADVLRSSAEQAAAKLQSVHPEVRNIFLPTAEKLLLEQGAGALAAAIAYVCGFSSEAMASRSLITHEVGLTTLKITCPTGQPITSAAAVMRVLSQILPSAANSLGKICMLSGSEVGAVFDLPAKLAKELLSLKIGSGEIIEALNKLPTIVEEPFGSDRFGGRPFLQRGPPGGRPGGFFGGRPGGFSNRPPDGSNWSNRSSTGSSGSDFFSRSPSSSGSNDWSSRSSSGFGSGNFGSSSRPPSSYGSGYSSNRSPSTPTSSFPSSSGGDWSSRPFSGQCLKCGQTGHRAVECPR